LLALKRAAKTMTGMKWQRHMSTGRIVRCLVTKSGRCSKPSETPEMDRQTRKLVAKALLDAASALSALTDRRLEYVLPGLAPRDQQSVLWIVFNAIGLERRVTPSIIGFVIDGKRFPMSEKDKEGYKAVLDYLKDDLAKNTVVDAYIPWLANQFKKGNAQSAFS